MKTTTVGEIQKNFAQVFKEIRVGEEIVVRKRGKPARTASNLLEGRAACGGISSGCLAMKKCG